MSFQVWKSISLFLFLLIKVFDCTVVNFCSNKFKCKNESNTICALEHNCGISKDCKGYEFHSITPDNKKLLVELHNFYRNKVAIRRVIPNANNTKLPPAADMKEMVWDKELEFLAQCWANQCPSIPRKPICFKNSAGEQLGLIVKHSTGKTFSYNLTMQDIYLDITYVTSDDIDSYKGIQDHVIMMIQNFFQLVYAKASQFGCARSRFFYEVFDEKAFFFVCFYNHVMLPKKKIYTVGKPCSLCSSCNKRYKGLCNTNRSNSEYLDICKHSNRTDCTSIMSNSSGITLVKESSAPELCKYAIKVTFFIWITIRIIKDL